MSDPITSKLPRFSVSSVSSLAAARRNFATKVEGGVQVPVPHVAKVEEEPEEPAPESPIVIPADEFRKKIDHLQVLIASLETTLAGVNQQAKAHAEAQLLAMAEELFPRLANEFLAEELVRHIPRLIPDLTPDIVMRLSQDLADPVQQALLRVPGLQERLTLEIGEELENSIQIVWPQGGCDFSFDELLNDVLQRLRPQSDEMKDS